MPPHMVCVICNGPIAGSNLLAPPSPGELGMIVTIHLIDEHWDIVERIHATTGDNPARLKLHAQIADEMTKGAAFHGGR